MFTVFLVCATLGGTILVLQFLLVLFGLGEHSLGLDVPHDIGHDLGGLGHDLAGDLHDAGVGDSDGHSDTISAPHAGGHASIVHYGSTWLFGVISFRTVVAALAFFGLAGLAAQAAEASATTTLAVASAAGLGAMYAVYAMMRGMQALRAEGTVHIQRALGRQASVYLRIPAKKSGSGKIQINLQNRTVEYLATTAGDAIPTGATVIVTDVLGSDLVQVQPISESERNRHA